jgi:methylmalonyl-CoA mutase C-terminal domain/subunit
MAVGDLAESRAAAAAVPVRCAAGKDARRDPDHFAQPQMNTPAGSKKIRVVVAKPGLDGHDRGAKIIARALRDAGMEVIYTGLHQTPEQIVATVIQEDADAVGLSILSGAHMTLVPKVVELLREQEAGDVVVVVGGTIPADDIPELKRLGIAEVFTPGAPTQAIIDFVRNAVQGQAENGAASHD